MAPVPTPTQRLADLLLGRPLREYVDEKRAAGLSWRRISQALAADTEGSVDVTHETLRSWMVDTPKAAAS